MAATGYALDEPPPFQLWFHGGTAAYVRDQMGHSSIKVTFDTYGHLFPGRGKEASGRYEKSMEEARKKATARTPELKQKPAMGAEKAQQADMPKIAKFPLPSGDVALIDASDLPLVSQYKWRLNVNEREGWVQVRAWTKRVNGNRSEVLFIGSSLQAGPGDVIRHRNGNGLDCRKENLLRCTASDRSHGQTAHRDKRTSKYKGVYFDKHGRERSPIMVQGKRKNLGSFTSQSEAAEAYDRAGA